MTTRTVVAIPGLHGSWVSWIPQMSMLADLADFLVADDACRHDSIPEMAAAILRDAPPRFSLAGYSMGGYVALEVVRQAPERVERLALISTSARGPRPNEGRIRDSESRLARADLLDQLVDCATDGVHPDRLHDPFILMARKLSAKVAGSETILNRTRAVLQRVDSRTHLQEISCKTLVVCGADDNVCPPELSREIAEGIEGARLVIVEHCGHFILYEQPASLNNELRAWLEA